MQLRSWAQEEFGDAKLGDLRRNRRLVSVVEKLEEHPGGRVTDVFPKGAEREGAFRLLESPYIQPEELERTRGAACMQRMHSLGGTFLVHVDKASITSSMAARAEHIKHHSREFPDAPATLVYTPEEIETMILWRMEAAPKAAMPYVPGDVPKLVEMTRWVADLGGHMKSSKVLPGTLTISRGLQRLELLVLGRRLSPARVKKRRISG